MCQHHHVKDEEVVVIRYVYGADYGDGFTDAYLFPLSSNVYIQYTQLYICQPCLNPVVKKQKLRDWEPKLLVKSSCSQVSDPGWAPDCHHISGRFPIIGIAFFLPQVLRYYRGRQRPEKQKNIQNWANCIHVSIVKIINQGFRHRSSLNWENKFICYGFRY